MKKKIFVLLTSLNLTLSVAVIGQTDTLRSYTTAHVVGEPPHIDGDTNDEAWNQVEWSADKFIQRQPNAGKEPSVETKFKILYDARNLYVLVLCLDPEPDKIVRRMSRRDSFEGDMVEINIDSYFDKRTAFSFTASVSGVKGDEYISNNGNNWDSNWDPIWYMKTAVTKEGWIAEMRIPLSQLRFADKPELQWGLQVTRIFFRNQERSVWQYIAPDAGGWVHLFGTLKGIKGIKPQKQLEIQPYVVAKTERYQEEAGNPFSTGKGSSLDGGLDAKIGITSDITLDLTVNPDFGQVEADPSQVNLTAFRLFFQERRPFFIEGNNILNFPVTGWGSNNLFYSRRIGRSPQGYPDTDRSGEDDVDEYVKRPSNTTILGAAKITGKNKNGFSWGVMESLTAAEHAEIDSLGHRRKEEIEPMTNYLVARAQQDINKGNTIIGAMVTSVNRNITNPQLDWLHDKAVTGGIDLTHYWKDRKYFVSFKGLMSHVHGSKEALTNTQRASERYFQRPDNHHAQVDSARTSLTGNGGTFLIGRQSGKIVYEWGFTWMSPGLELNDIGFLTQTDLMTQWIWAQYRKLQPFGKFRWSRINMIQFTEWDYGWNNTSTGFELNSNSQFKNFWFLGTGFAVNTRAISNADLRGGPSLRYPGDFQYWLYVSTDNRKKVQVGVNPYFTSGFDGFKSRRGLDLEFSYRPVNALTLSVEPGFNKSNNQLQYITTVEHNGAERHIVGEIDQATLRISLRFTYMLTPNLSIQYWGQPFGSSGRYRNFKYITDPHSSKYDGRFHQLLETQVSTENDEFEVDENNDGQVDYTFSNPDFNFGQFRSNFVLRWEYIPGSTLFLVWTQERNGDFYQPQSFGNRSGYSFEFNDKAYNVFLIKYTYRFIL